VEPRKEEEEEEEEEKKYGSFVIDLRHLFLKLLLNFIRIF
jgi:hypothetical protein